MTVQAILFEKSKWTVARAKAWVSQHGHKPIKPPHTTANHIRFRLYSPKKFKRMRTIAIGKGIKFIVGFK